MMALINTLSNLKLSCECVIQQIDRAYKLGLCDCGIFQGGWYKFPFWGQWYCMKTSLVLIIHFNLSFHLSTILRSSPEIWYGTSKNWMACKGLWKQ